MSQLEPYDYSQFPPDDDDFDEPMQMRGGQGGWQGGWRPPPQRPPFGPAPGGGGWPFWGYWGFRLRSAWRDIKFLQKLLQDIVGEMISDGIIAPGPNSPVQGPSGGIKGVTDGSNAGPGQVGEFVTGNVAIPYTAYPNVTTSSVSPLVVQPGDWDLWAYITFSTLYGGASVQLTPVPTGMSNDMKGDLTIGSVIHTQGSVINCKPARGNFSVPTLLAFQFSVNQQPDPTLTAGTATLTVEARRRR